jgi:hypothetical protein
MANDETTSSCHQPVEAVSVTSQQQCVKAAAAVFQKIHITVCDLLRGEAVVSYKASLQKQ